SQLRTCPFHPLTGLQGQPAWGNQGPASACRCQQPPAVDGPVAFFPAESTCTNIDSEMLIGQDTGRRKEKTQPRVGWQEICIPHLHLGNEGCGPQVSAPGAWFSICKMGGRGSNGPHPPWNGEGQNGMRRDRKRARAGCRGPSTGGRHRDQAPALLHPPGGQPDESGPLLRDASHPVLQPAPPLSSPTAYPTRGNRGLEEQGVHGETLSPAQARSTKQTCRVPPALLAHFLPVDTEPQGPQSRGS
ncbi:hypothetical protein E2I00_017054, partial [Balaenoptera physalus]